MIPKLKEPIWHKVSDCLGRFPIHMTEKRLNEYLLKLKIIKDEFDLSFHIHNRNVKTIFYNYSDYDFYVPYISESCINIIVTHIYEELERNFTLDALDNLIELYEQGLATEEEIENYKSKHKLS